MIELKTLYPSGVTVESGGETFDVAAGKSVKLGTYPQGEIYLDATVPSGKKWTVTVSIQIKEMSI